MVALFGKDLCRLGLDWVEGPLLGQWISIDWSANVKRKIHPQLVLVGIGATHLRTLLHTFRSSFQPYNISLTLILVKTLRARLHSDHRYSKYWKYLFYRRPFFKSPNQLHVLQSGPQNVKGKMFEVLEKWTGQGRYNLYYQVELRCNQRFKNILSIIKWKYRK